MGESAVEALLQNGYWQPSKTRISDNPNTSRSAIQEHRLVPRSGPLAVRHARNHPPPPSVEDESHSLAREHNPELSDYSAEEPANRGKVEQDSLLEEVPEFIQERRFVLVPSVSDSPPRSPVPERKPQSRRNTNITRERPHIPIPEPDYYEANTGRKCAQTPSRDDRIPKPKEVRPDRERRRTRLEDLHPIITSDQNDDRSQDSRRPKSASRHDPRGDDYFSPRLNPPSSRVQRDSLLSPEVIEHATNGRDRPYYKGGLNLEPSGRNRTEQPSRTAVPNDRMYREKSPIKSNTTSATSQKRNTMEGPPPKYNRRDSKESYDQPRPYTEVSPSKLDRRAQTPAASQSERDSGSRRSSTPPPGEKTRTSKYYDTMSSSEEEKRSDRERRRRSGVPSTRDEPPKAAPAGARSMEPRVETRKSRGPSPLPPTNNTQNSSDQNSGSSSPRSGTSGGRDLKPSRNDERLPEQPLSRASTAKGSFTVPTSNIIPSVSSTPVSGISADPRRQTMAPPSRASTLGDPRSSAPTLSSSIPINPVWQPPKFEPSRTNNTNSNAPISSYRRYSLEIKHGELPDIPQCPRTREEAGHLDWLTLPRCDNFNICPSCYSANFANTEFAHHFVPVPFRPRDRALACDFGTSEYYRIAWLFTRKYGKPDLTFLQSLIKLAAQSQPCTGHHEVSRIWYSVKDPRSKRPIHDFTVCHACAKTVETLLPSLTGVFVPMDSPAEPTRGVCAMHQDRGHDRGRFLLYFDVLEGAADRALETQSAPNIQALADRIRELSAVPPCPEGRPLRNALWHTMRSVPDLIVCPECFMIVIRPLLDSRHEDLTVVGDFFHKPTRMANGDCMLYSERMRGVFERAIRHRDIGYLADKARERNDKEREMADRLKVLQRQGLSQAAVEAETRRLMAEWKKYE
ncbi:hypothetical protein F5Y16DRAFT_272634 [Xylariaceae sp. FL0255]|nr:hypothetical protein F5Y16DRAFT_272634 [Xylariaceae sp. FL0255]